jgi:hypothetical protein
VTGTGASAVVGGAISYAASDYSFSDGLGNFGDISWDSLIYEISPKTVDDASTNGLGGYDYIIGTRGYPARLTAVGTDPDFPNEIGANAPGYWNPPVASTVPMINYPDTHGITTYEFQDPLWENSASGEDPPDWGLTSQFFRNIGTTASATFGPAVSCVDTLTDNASACESVSNMLNDARLDNLIMMISTNGSGEVVSGTAYAVREGNRLTVWPGGTRGENDEFAATVWSFSISADQTDTDGDGLSDADDNCDIGANGPVIPDAYNTSQGDFDNDGIPNPNSCNAVDDGDLDDDNDLTLDVVDGCPIDPTGYVDSDADGVCTDTTVVDNCPSTPNGPAMLDPDDEGISQRDTDNDGLGDACDSDDDNDGLPDTVELGIYQGSTERLKADTDNDGVIDSVDDLPLDPTETIDTDGDGTGNNADDDDDNDTVLDVNDVFPLDPTEWDDTDGDGMGDNGDNCPNVQNTAAFPDSEGWAPQQDDDSDNIGNACDLVITTFTLPAGRAGKIYSQQLTHLRGTPPFTWTITTGAPPSFVTLNTDGLLYGEVQSTFLSFFTVQVMDSTGDTATQDLSMAVTLPNCVNCHSASAE